MSISVVNLSDIETGKTKPRYEFYAKIAVIFNVDLNYLISGKGTPFYDVTVGKSQAEKPPVIQGNYINLEYTNDDEKKFLTYFSESKLVRYHMLALFSKLLLEEGSSIEKEMNEI